MAVASPSATSEFVEALVARDFPRACSHLDAGVDFRGMTPKRIWEADAPAGVEDVLRAWFEHPERQVERVEALAPTTVEDTVRVGWRVHGHGADGPFVFEQQAFAREQAERVVWLRVMCSGPRPVRAGR